MTNYQLTFRIIQKGVRKGVHLGFVVAKKHERTLHDALSACAAAYDSQHLRERHQVFMLPYADLLEKRKFGFGDCGFVSEDKEHLTFHVCLRHDFIHEATATIALLTTALFALGQQKTGKAGSYLHIRTFGDPKIGLHGHGITGNASSTFLKSVARLNPRPHARWRTIVSCEHAKEKILRNMRRTWRTVSRPEWRQFAQECSLRLDDVHFLFGCFGNACDAGVYPDGIRASGILADIDCHNLDTAEQQLTLLAGFASLCDLVRTMPRR